MIMMILHKGKRESASSAASQPVSSYCLKAKGNNAGQTVELTTSAPTGWRHKIGQLARCDGSPLLQICTSLVAAEAGSQAKG